MSCLYDRLGSPTYLVYYSRKESKLTDETSGIKVSQSVVEFTDFYKFQVASRASTQQWMVGAAYLDTLFLTLTVHESTTSVVGTLMVWRNLQDFARKSLMHVFPVSSLPPQACTSSVAPLHFILICCQGICCS